LGLDSDWQAAQIPVFGRYQQMTTRRIPVIVLDFL
jgi:hypothetical protein